MIASNDEERILIFGVFLLNALEGKDQRLQLGKIFLTSFAVCIMLFLELAKRSPHSFCSVYVRCL